MGAEQSREEAQRKAALTTEVTVALEDFYTFIWEPQRRDARAKATIEQFSYRQRAASVPSSESLLAKYDPEQSVKALELEDILAKLHECVVSYRLVEKGEVVGHEVTNIDGLTIVSPIRERREPEPWVMYVRDHVVDFNTFGSWTVGLCVEEITVTKRQLERRGLFIQPFDAMYDFEVVNLDYRLAD